jgi:hypothetical protein
MAVSNVVELPRKATSKQRRNEYEKGVSMSFELHEVLIFCGFYSSLVIFSLWITVAEKVEVKAKRFYK